MNKVKQNSIKKYDAQVARPVCVFLRISTDLIRSTEPHRPKETQGLPISVYFFFAVKSGAICSTPRKMIIMCHSTKPVRISRFLGVKSAERFSKILCQRIQMFHRTHK